MRHVLVITRMSKLALSFVLSRSLSFLVDVSKKAIGESERCFLTSLYTEEVALRCCWRTSWWNEILFLQLFELHVSCAAIIIFSHAHQNETWEWASRHLPVMSVAREKSIVPIRSLRHFSALSCIQYRGSPGYWLPVSWSSEDYRVDRGFKSELSWMTPVDERRERQSCWYLAVALKSCLRPRAVDLGGTQELDVHN